MQRGGSQREQYKDAMSHACRPNYNHINTLTLGLHLIILQIDFRFSTATNRFKQGNISTNSHSVVCLSHYACMHHCESDNAVCYTDYSYMSESMASQL